MYESFEEAKAGALELIAKHGGGKNGCCVSETKLTKNSKRTFFGFRFYSEDTNGEFIPDGYGGYCRLYKI